MIPVTIHTALDLDPSEKWPDFLHALPREGDLIESSRDWNGVVLELEVKKVRWRYSKAINNWYSVVELHFPSGRWESINDFHAWYKKIRNKV
jgi:hypothetical protein